MNEFNKKYLQIAKKYNYQPNELIEEGFLSDIGGFFSKILNIIKKGPTALLDLVKEWFNKANNPQSAKKEAILVTKLLSVEKKLPIKEGMFDWFSDVCNQVKSGIKLIKSENEMKKFHNYIKIKNNLSDQQIKNISYSDCKKNLTDFVKQQISNKNVVTENKQLIYQVGLLITVIGLTVCFLIVVGVGYWVWTKIRDGVGIGAEGKANQHKANLEAQEKMTKANIEYAEKMQQLNLQQLTNLLKGCDALK